ncbi:MAG: hypothetical protein LPK38_00985 [Actinomycetes bacterium]|nr:hypothetical protein [Actinomycetes bacterium]MDX5449594.1 hypothetical protein [Actinomycetes bacterium]
MSRSYDILTAAQAAIAVSGANVDLSATGRVLIGMWPGPPIGGAFVCLSEDSVSTAEAVDVTRWTYRAAMLIQAWAPADSDSQAARIEAAQAIRSDILAALHGAVVDPSTRAAAMRTASVRDVQIASSVMAGEMIADAWAGWGYAQVQMAYTADGGPGEF